MPYKNHPEKADALLQEIQRHPQVRRMKRFIQHGRVSTFQHCDAVARLSCRLNRIFHLHADEAALVRGGMLHDFYLYDWHMPDSRRPLHGFHHPERALRNAERYFRLSEKEREIIRCHMWPLTITKLPRSREAWIVCMADKSCALLETIGGR